MIQRSTPGQRPLGVVQPCDGIVRPQRKQSNSNSPNPRLSTSDSHIASVAIFDAATINRVILIFTHNASKSVIPESSWSTR